MMLRSHFKIGSIIGGSITFGSLRRKARPLMTAAVLGYGMLIWGCFSGGLAQEGGPVSHPLLISSATLTRGTPYQIVCWDRQEVLRREKAGLQADGSKPDAPATGDNSDKKGTTPAGISGKVLGPPVKYRDAAGYRGGCEAEGRHSVFFLVGIFPVTPPLNPDYAISEAVQRLGGDTMINIRAWHETHYYSALGKVEVFKVRGDVIRFLTASRIVPEEKKKPERRRGRRRRGRR